MDSSILIRTADIDGQGRMRIGVGATLVRHSDPASEAAETRAKVSTMLAAAGISDGAYAATEQGGSASPRNSMGSSPAVRSALARRNESLAPFWFTPPGRRTSSEPALTGRSVLVVDAEDTFTAMLGHELRSIGPEVRIETWKYLAMRLELSDRFDVVVVGPGPGDPTDHHDPRIGVMRSLTGRLLDRSRLFLSVCLGHQVLADLLGFGLVRKTTPSQGLQREIELFGRRRLVGFYNTFAATSPSDCMPSARVGSMVTVSRDEPSGEVHALVGRGFVSVQFHPESVLTQHGPEVLADMLHWVLQDQRAEAIAGTFPATG